MAKLVLVRFRDGTFGVREQSFLGEPRFVDLKDVRYKWSLGSSFAPDCRGTEEEARKVFELLTDKGTPVK